MGEDRRAFRFLIEIAIEVVDPTTVRQHITNFGHGTEDDHWQNESPQKWEAQVGAVISHELGEALGRSRAASTGLLSMSSSVLARPPDENGGYREMVIPAVPRLDE